jgi:hypothetical protein
MFLPSPLSAFASNDARNLQQQKVELFVGEKCFDKFRLESEFHLFLGIFYMLQICDLGQKALLPLRRKACWGFFSPLKIRRLRPGLNPQTWVPKASTLPLDHGSRYFSPREQINVPGKQNKRYEYSFCLMVEASDHGYVLHTRRIHVTRYKI